MKLDPIFTVKENKLYKIADNSPFDLAALKKFEISWSQVELEPESYNEEFLANLREELKSLEAQGVFAVIVPKIDKALKNAEETELFINAFNHCARRIKDCTSVAGFELPAEITKNGFAEDSDAGAFMDALAKKHAQYVYFSAAAEAVPATIVKYWM